MLSAINVEVPIVSVQDRDYPVTYRKFRILATLPGRIARPHG